MSHSDHITSRQRQSQSIMREKLAKKRRGDIRRKFRLLLLISLVFAVISASGVFWYYERSFSVIAAIKNTLLQITADSGLAVRSLHIEGRSRTAMADIERKINIRKNEPILGLSLADIRNSLKEINSIREADVERVLPDALYVRIIEREPVALWQNKGQRVLVDERGIIMQGVDISPYSNLPLIVGNGAPEHVSEFLKIMSAAPELARNCRFAIYVGNRRWNIRLARDIEVKLPESGADLAMAKLEKLEKDSQLFNRDIKVIDLRVPDRMFIKLSPQLLQNEKNVAVKNFY